MVQSMTVLPNKSPEPTPLSLSVSVIAVHVASSGWLSFFVRPLCTTLSLLKTLPKVFSRLWADMPRHARPGLPIILIA